ncbi:hypothetical protein TNCV_4609781 [Trichonephila clavipes]|nr:hypothetical protein TNCV_4609781 [Trichonephila clavipes]
MVEDRKKAEERLLEREHKLELVRKKAKECRREQKQEFEFARIEARRKTENETKIREARHKEEMEARLKAEGETRLKAEGEAKAVEEWWKIEEERRMNERIVLEDVRLRRWKDGLWKSRCDIFRRNIK